MFLYFTQKKAQQAKVVVTNYHMLFSCMNANSSVFNDASCSFDGLMKQKTYLESLMQVKVSIGTGYRVYRKKIKEIENKLGRKNEIIGLENTEKLSNYAKEFFNWYRRKI